MSSPRYLTKSRFKLALECPTKLFYTGKKDIYPDKKIDDPFMQALANGGFQIGELAKCYFPEGVEVKTDRGDYEGALAETARLLELEEATIFEAAVRFENFFIRIDVLVKRGSRIEVIEVKSKSYESGATRFVGARGGISSEWKPYLEDIAFQKHVVQGAFPGHHVDAFLMLADKASRCPSDGLNQKFRVKVGPNDIRSCEVASELSAEETDPNSWILTKIDVNEICDKIFATTYGVPGTPMPFDEFAAELSSSYQRDEKIVTPISSTCKTCEFRATEAEESEGKISGFKACWKGQLGWSDADFCEPTVLDIWDNRSKDKMLGAGKIKLTSLTESDIEQKPSDKDGISRTERQWLQVEKAVSGDSTYFLDKLGLRAEMRKWKFPLHFIDFETATPGIPFTKGRRPYEEVAFQFSHHIVQRDGTLEHASEYLDDRIAVFPNYDFVRRLRDDLSKDDGTIFRYAAHENTYLIKIFGQLSNDADDIVDRDELCEFIKSITTGSKREFGDNCWEGSRNMVDLLDLVKRYYYDPYTKGSNSIKQVLPAILNSSKYLQEKYSRPIYGTDIPSHNFTEGKVWATYENGRFLDPYSNLPKVFGDDLLDRMSDEDELKDGGAAMIAYARLQFEDMSDPEREAIKAALKRYCELDTLAMVMIYEGWRDMVE